MKRIIVSFAFLISLLLMAAPLMAHHAAEGIVSDDIWQSIDENLTDSNSPHQDMELDLDSMMTNDVVVSTVRVPNEDVGEVLTIIEEEAGGSVSIDINTVGNNFTVITITEVIGAGQSQVVETPQ
jgi:hypothetical protein